MALSKSGTRYAISDIHGCCKTFVKLLKKIEFKKRDTLYLLGDYVDRGPDSKGVVDYIMDLKKDGYNVITLMGNHEDMLLSAIYKDVYLKSWLNNGGDVALKSFDVSHPKNLEGKYIEFFNGLERYVELEDYFLVHAGFNFKIDNPLEDKQAMLWIRKSVPPKSFLVGKKIIHGHTPVGKNKIIKSLKKEKPSINIDAGCVYADKLSLGRLCAINLDNLSLTFAKNKKDVS